MPITRQPSVQCQPMKCLEMNWKEREKKLEKQWEKYQREKGKQKKYIEAKGKGLKKSSSRKGTYRSRNTAADMEQTSPWSSRKREYAMARAAEICGVPRITLLSKINGHHRGDVGRPSVFSEAEESVLVQVLVQMGQFNFPLTKRRLSEMVNNYLDQTMVTRIYHNSPNTVWNKKISLRDTSIVL
jgi:hypothetical protein